MSFLQVRPKVATLVVLVLVLVGAAALVVPFVVRAVPQDAAGSGAEPDSQIQWASIGPQNVLKWGGKVNAFAYVQSNPEIMYIGAGWGNTPLESPSQSGIYRTTDGGATWTSANNGLTNPDGTISSVINSLWLDQSNPSVVLASTEFGGTFKSSDGGATWHNADRAEATRFSQSGTSLYLATRKGILVSNDDGDTWTVSLPLSDGATTVDAVGAVVYAGSTSGDVYELSGSSWTKLGHPGTGPIHDLAVDPWNTQVVYASVDDAGVWNEALHASVDGGVTWTSVNCQCLLGAQAIAYSQVTPHRLFLGDDGRPVVRYLKGDGNPKPAIYHGARFNGADIRYVVVGPGKTKDDDACYLLQDQGLYFAPKCSSGDATLLSRHVDNTLAYDVAMSPDGKTILASLQDNDPAFSTNGGKKWAAPPPTFTEGGETVYHWDNSGFCYYVHPNAGLYISEHGCTKFPHNVFPGFESLTFDRTNADVMYAVVGENISKPIVSKSVDKGLTWSPTKWHFKDPYQVVVSPIDPNSIVVATGTPTTPSSLFYSRDGGKTWNQSGGLPVSQLKFRILDYPVHQFFAAFDPQDDQTILLADRDPSTENILMYRSSDGGQTFSLVHTLVQPVPPRPWPLLRRPKDEEHPRKNSFYFATRFFGNRVVFNPNPQKGVPDVVVTTRFGAFLSADLGTGWTRIDTNATAHHFVGATWNQGYLYLASFGQGLLRSAAPIQP
jgi:hypothetical protein